MATISLYDPDTGAYASISGAALTNTAAMPKLLLNILIELRVASAYLADIAPTINDDPQSLRNDIITHGPYV